MHETLEGTSVSSVVLTLLRRLELIFARRRVVSLDGALARRRSRSSGAYHDDQGGDEWKESVTLTRSMFTHSSSCPEEGNDEKRRISEVTR